VLVKFGKAGRVALGGLDQKPLVDIVRRGLQPDLRMALNKINGRGE
jgi:hypothetical protein